ncbi:MAG: flavin reductase family protein [Nitrospirae bacterium]|nr:flavin reductase family protein [Nitrospirota bacterium]
MKQFDPGEQSTAENYLFMLNAIVPRPIAWISTLGQNGVENLAPFSFFNGVCAEPPIVSISIARRNGEKKDTLRNIEYSKEFVVNVVTESLASAMNESSASHSAEISEFKRAGLTPYPAQKVKAPLVLESPINMECQLYRLIEIGVPPQGSTLVLGQIVYCHLRHEILTDGQIDFKKFLPVGRLGRDMNLTARDLFPLRRPR